MLRRRVDVEDVQGLHERRGCVGVGGGGRSGGRRMPGAPFPWRPLLSQLSARILLHLYVFLITR